MCFIGFVILKSCFIALRLTKYFGTEPNTIGFILSEKEIYCGNMLALPLETVLCTHGSS